MFVIKMIWWTGLAPWEVEFPFPGSLISTFLDPQTMPSTLYPSPPQEISKVWHFKGSNVDLRLRRKHPYQLTKSTVSRY